MWRSRCRSVSVRVLQEGPRDATHLTASDPARCQRQRWSVGSGVCLPDSAIGCEVCGAVRKTRSSRAVAVTGTVEAGGPTDVDRWTDGSPTAAGGSMQGPTARWLLRLTPVSLAI